MQGSFDAAGNFLTPPAGAHELDLEQDVFGALRVLGRGQLSLLVPLVQTWRAALGVSDLGGGVGDINLNARYDFLYAGASRWVPGLALLGGVTLPTGRTPDATGVGPLAAGATGIGAYQLSFGAAAEQAFGPWLVNATVFAAQRSARTVGAGVDAIHETLAPQWTALLAVAYTFHNDTALALSLSEVAEGNATINGGVSASSGRRLPTLAVSGVLPVTDAMRLQASVYDNPPIAELGANQLADIGASLTSVLAWR